MSNLGKAIKSQVETESLKGISPLAYKLFKVYPEESLEVDGPFIWLQMGSERCWSLVANNYIPSKYGCNSLSGLAREIQDYMSEEYPTAVQLESQVLIPRMPQTIPVSELIGYITL